MKMSYLLRNKSKKDHGKRLLILGILFFSLMFFFKLFDGFITRTVSPIWNAENILMRTIRLGWENFQTREALVEENMRLKVELESLRTSLSSSVEPISLELAVVLAGPPHSFYDTLVIDRGSSDGLIVGQEIFIPEGSVIGVAAQVHKTTSVVELFSSYGNETAAILERTKLPVLLIGRGAGNFKIEAPREEWVEVGDRILSLSSEPKLIAVVEDVVTGPTDSFKKILARSPVNIFSLAYVSFK